MTEELPSDDLAVPDEVVVAEIVEEDDDPRKARLAELESRRKQSMADGQIDNATLHAGAPMYYYCKYCGVQTDVKPEGWFATRPTEVCPHCTSLIELGWHDGLMPVFPAR